MTTISQQSNGFSHPSNIKNESSHIENVAPRKSDKQYTDVKTKALVVEKPKADFQMTEIILDEVRGDEVLIDMKYSGICHTDIVLQQGLLPLVDFPAIFGHEGAGVVVAIGENVKDKNLRVGDAVTLSFQTCGSCVQCSKGHPAFCHDHPNMNHNAIRKSDKSTPARLKDGTSVRSQYFGHSSFAKMSVVNEECVVKCPYPDNLAIYSPLGCGFQTGAGTVLNVLKPEQDSSIAIFGMGSVGLTALMAAKYMNIRQIIAVDIVDQKLELAKELGATHLVNSRSSNAVEEIKKITGEGANYTIDCTGVLKVIEQIIEALAPCGTAATVGVPPVNSKIQIDPLDFLLANKKYVGVIEGDSVPADFLPRLMDLHKQGHFPIEKLCKVYPIADFEQAIHDLHAGSVVKPVLKWD